MSEIVQPLRFCGVLCIARSVSQPIGRHAQLTRCFSVVAELLVYIHPKLIGSVLVSTTQLTDRQTDIQS